ncbi:MAG: glycosyltransferase family 8 protein, partial [Kiritimatiellae bacterium]|nr:glycosyltransferase family 8 protein [Kiritimatiellia bacterium]
MTEVPIVHCFDHNYVLPAGVAFRSLLAHARHADVMYLLYVIGSGLTDDDKALLDGIVGKFENARLEFLPPPELPLPKLKRGNFSRDMFYKMLVP